MPVTTYDTMNAPSRVGGPGTYLNVNAGSLVSGQEWRQFLPHATSLSMDWADICFHNGELWTVHCERNTSDSITPAYGPYVHRWDGSSWSAVGGELDTSTGSGPNVLLKVHPSICSDDGDNVFVTWWTMQYDAILHVWAIATSMAQWDGTSWTTVLSLIDVTGFGEGQTERVPYPSGLCATGGDAWMAYVDNGGNVHIHKSDGTSSAVSFLADFPAGVPLCIQPYDGRPVGVATEAATFATVLFDATDGSTLATTAESDLAPYGYAGIGDNGPQTQLIPYFDDQMIVSNGSHGPLVFSQLLASGAASGGFVVLGGADYFIDAFGVTGGQIRGLDTIVQDTVDPRQVWILGDNATFDLNDFTSQVSISSWGPACTSEKLPPNPDNPAPVYEWRPSIFNDIVPYDDDPDIFASNPTQLGHPKMVVEGDHIYAVVVYGPNYAPMAPPDQSYETQVIVWDLPICRGCGTCPPYTTNVFRDEFKTGDPQVPEAPPVDDDPTVNVFHQTPAWKPAD